MRQRLQIRHLLFVALVLVTTPVHARDKLPPGFVYLRDVDSSIAQDIRYAIERQFHRPSPARLWRRRMRAATRGG